MKIKILLILLLALGLRLYNFGQIPTGLYWDEIAILVDAKTVAATGQDMHSNAWWQLIYPSYGDFKLPVYIWLASLSVGFFGVSSWAVRLPSLLAGLGTVYLSGCFARDFFSQKKSKSKNHLQLMVMLVVALSPWSIMFSRTGFEGHLAQFLVVASAWMLLKTKDRWWLILPATLLGSLATYSYFSVRFVWPAILVSILIFTFGKKFWKLSLLGLVIYGLLLLPMLKSPLYEASNQFRYSADSILNQTSYSLDSNQSRVLLGNHWYDRLFFHRHAFLLKELGKNYADHLSLNFLFINGDDNLRHGTGQHGLFLLVFLPLFLVGLYQLFDKRPTHLAVILIWWMAALLPASVPETTPHALRSLNALLPLSLIIGYGWWKFQTNTTVFLKILMTSLIILSVAEFSYHYLTQYRLDSAYDWQADYQLLAAEIHQQVPHVANIYILNFDERFYLWLLADDAMSPEAIQSLPDVNFQLKQWEKVSFNGFDWTKLDSLDRKIILAGPDMDLQNQLTDHHAWVSWEKKLGQTSDGLPKFKVVMLEPQ